MSDGFPRNFKLIDLYGGFDNENKPFVEFICCQDTKQLNILLTKYGSCDIILSCPLSKIPDILELIRKNYNIKVLYVVEDCDDDWYYPEYDQDGLTWVRIENDQNLLMRHLYLKAMLCYYNQGLEYKQNGDIGLANQCFMDAKKALEQAKLTIKQL